MLGHPARGEPGADPLNRLTGDGRVSLKRGEYSDAADKGHHTLLHVTEPSGACSRSLTRLLRDTSKTVGLPGVHDSTVYGTSRASPRSYFSHHIAAISSAIRLADTLTILNHSSNLHFQLTLTDAAVFSPLPPRAPPAGMPGGPRA